jgi:prepilin-type N-terminal cleavage/methylation domain-containing protein
MTPKGSGNDRGFTLVEMLISLSIFAVVTAFVTANFRVGRQGDELRLSSQLAATAIRRAQTLATAGQTTAFCRGGTNDLKTCPSGLSSECGGGTCVVEVPRGYGIRFSTAAADARKLITFADLDGDRAYDVGELLRTDAVSPGLSVRVSTLSPTAGSTLDIVFEPPKPTVYFNGSTATGIATITTLHSVTNQVKNVTVNRITGQVNAD